MAVSQRRLVDRADRLRAAGAPSRPDGGPAQRRGAGLAERRTAAGRRMDTARFGGAEHLGDGPGGVVAPGHDRGWQACARRRLAPAPKRNGVVADFPSERVSARGQGAGWPGTERLAMVSGNRGLGDADLSRHSGIEEMLLAAALYGTAGA